MLELVAGSTAETHGLFDSLTMYKLEQIDQALASGAWPKVPTAHPLLRVPSAKALAAARREPAKAEPLRQFLWKRERKITLAVERRVEHGFRLPSWDRADRVLAQPGVRELCVFGGNRASKTTWAADKVMNVLIEKPGSNAWVFHESESESRERQQPEFHKLLPPEWRGLKGRGANTTFSEKGGFSENRFVLPNMSRLTFRFYKQDIRSIEGGELDIAWCDELVPVDFLKTLRYRLMDRDGLLLVTFTPKEGLSDTVREYVDGMVWEESAPAPLLPILKDGDVVGHKKRPLVARCRKKKAKVVYFWTQHNPFFKYSNLVEELKGESEKEIDIRAYGYCKKTSGAQFALNQEGHVVSVGRLPKVGTWRMVADPCPGRNWFMQWWLATPQGQHICMREWPQPDDYIPGAGPPGVWAVRGKMADGERGPAQLTFRFGYEDYKLEIERIERELHTFCTGEEGGRIEVFERIMDSRFANHPTLSSSEATTHIEELEKLGLFFEPAPGGRGVFENEGPQAIVSWLRFNEEERITPLNQPTMLFSERVENTLYAMENWTGADGNKGATKDPIDCVRYYRQSEPGYVDLMGMRQEAYERERF
ncbi:MAG: hypothetical protein AAF555_05750 [Verrucomicrobiota bacterium]